MFKEYFNLAYDNTRLLLQLFFLNQQSMNIKPYITLKALMLLYNKTEPGRYFLANLCAGNLSSNEYDLEEMVKAHMLPY